MRCYKCATEIVLTARVGRGEYCQKCYSDLHCCRNCAHYDSAATNQCREPQAESVRDREKANFCDYFTPNTHKGTGGDDSSAARDAFKKLFK